MRWAICDAQRLRNRHWLLPGVTYYYYKKKLFMKCGCTPDVNMCIYNRGGAHYATSVRENKLVVEMKVLIYCFIQSIFICRRQYKKMYMRILWMCISVKLSTWLSLNLRNAYEISFVLDYDDFDHSWRRRGKSTFRQKGFPRGGSEPPT